MQSSIPIFYNAIPKPPFYGSQVVTDIPLEDVYKYINPVVLFRARWGYRRQKHMSVEKYDQFIEEAVVPIFQSYKQRCADKHWLRPQVVYGYFHAQADGDDLIIYHDDAKTEWIRFTFPRQTHTEARLCISDFFANVDSGRLDVAAFQLVTVGGTITEVVNELLNEGEAGDAFHLRGLGIETAEALAEYFHRYIRIELDMANEDSPNIFDLFHCSYRGVRHTFGYPACPNLTDQSKLWPLLKPERISVELSETYQLVPENSIAAIVVHHPEARYFNVK